MRLEKNCFLATNRKLESFLYFYTDDIKRKGNLTYDDPFSYKGPIVEGWPPTRNRSVFLYIKRKVSSDNFE